MTSHSLYNCQGLQCGFYVLSHILPLALLECLSCWFPCLTLLWLPLPAWSLHLFTLPDPLFGFFCIRKAPRFQIFPSPTPSCISAFCSATLPNECPPSATRNGSLVTWLSTDSPASLLLPFSLLFTWHIKYGFTYCLSLLSRIQILWNREVCFVPWHIQPKGWTIPWLPRYQQCLVDK